MQTLKGPNVVPAFVAGVVDESKLQTLNELIKRSHVSSASSGGQPALANVDHLKKGQGIGVGFEELADLFRKKRAFF